MEVRNVHTLGDVKFWGGWSLVGSVGRGQGACAWFDLLQAWVRALALYLFFLFVFPLRTARGGTGGGARFTVTSVKPPPFVSLSVTSQKLPSQSCRQEKFTSGA